MRTGPSQKKHTLYASFTILGILILLAILIILYLLTFNQDPNSTDRISTYNSEHSNSVNQTYPPDTRNNIYIAGTYKIGVDMPAGEYVVVNSQKIEISSDNSNTADSILIKESSAPNYCYIFVQNGEFLTVAGGEIFPLSETSSLDQPTYTDGIYLVGRDIFPGEYQLIADGYGHWERNKLPVSSKRDGTTIIANDNFQDSTTITVNKGEYLKLSNGTTLINSNNSRK